MRTILIIGGLVGLVSLGSFFYKNFRGAGPAILPPTSFPTIAPTDVNGGPPRVSSNDLGVTLPPGFSISIAAQGIENARVITSDPAKNLIVSSPSENSIFLLRFDKESNGFELPQPLLRDLSRPHGIALSDCIGDALSGACKLLIGETHRVLTYLYRYGDATIPNGPVSSPDSFFEMPSGGNHFTRTVGIGPDSRLYVSIGSSCNVCVEKDPRRAAIYSMNLNGSDVRPFATGLRNSVFFTWHPKTGKMWAAEMGRDLLGDDTPPDEINIVEEGKDYGWPYCYGQNIHDLLFDKRNYHLDRIEFDGDVCSGLLGKSPSHIDLPAHSAPLGLAFIPENNSWPKEYWGDLLVAYHGSWNRSVPTGYKVVRIKLDENGNSEGIEDFITGWLAENGEATGRPVDLLFVPDGTLYISDDKAGVIYRVQSTGTP